MLTAPLTGARYPEPTDGPLGALQIGYAVADLEDNAIPRFATTGARDTAYAAWVAAGNTMTAGLFCTVAGRLQRHDGTSWDYVPTHRGSGTTYPSSGVTGDTYYHTGLVALMVLSTGGTWRQVHTTLVANTGSRDAISTTYAAALHDGFAVHANDDDTNWQWTGTTWDYTGGGTPARNTAQVQRLGLTIGAANDTDAWTKVASWATVHTSPDIGIAANGTITCNKAGWVSVSGYAFSDDTVAGRSMVALDIPAASFPVSRLVESRARIADTSFVSAGLLRQPFAWSGRVVAGDTFSILLNQDNADNGAIDYNIYAAVEYLA